MSVNYSRGSAPQAASTQVSASSRIPPEIALHISQYLDVRDLARAAVAWRPVAMAVQSSREFIKLECARFCLATYGKELRSDVIRPIRYRMEQYNVAWATLQYTAVNAFSVPQTTNETFWAGSEGWQSGHRFMGESNGYLYDVLCWDPTMGEQRQARVNLYQLPSLRTGEVDFKMRHIELSLRSHLVKAITVDPANHAVAILEYNNTYTDNYYSRIPHLHVYDLDGQRISLTQVKIGFSPYTEIAHMELHGEMVCIVANRSSPHGTGTISEMVVQSWTDQPRVPEIKHGLNPHCTGFQFLTENLWICTERSKLNARDTIPSCVVWIGHIGLKLQRMLPIKDPLSNGWTPNNISLIRNVAPYSDSAAAITGTPFATDPSVRLFGLKFDYRGFDGTVRSTACIFGTSTVEGWLNIPKHTNLPREPVHWITIPRLDFPDARAAAASSSSSSPARMYDTSNRAGVSLVGRRLCSAEITPLGWHLHVVDYNPGAGSVVAKQNLAAATGQHWRSVTFPLFDDPYTVVHSATSRISGLDRVIPYEDGILLKEDGAGAPHFTALMM